MQGELVTIRATVLEVDGRSALVEVEQGGCGRCHEKGGCGGRQLTQMFCSSPKKYQVDNRLGATIGDRVVVAIDSGGISRSANLVYILPLILAIAGAMLGLSLGDDLGAILGAVLGLILAFAFIRFRTQNWGESQSDRPYIISRT